MRIINILRSYLLSKTEFDLVFGMFVSDVYIDYDHN